MLVRQIEEVRRRGKCKVRSWRFGERFVVLGMKEGRDGNRRAGFSGICAVYTRNMRLTFRFPFNDTTWTRAKPNAANAGPGDVSHSNWVTCHWSIKTIRVDEETLLIHLVLYRMLVRILISLLDSCLVVMRQRQAIDNLGHVLHKSMHSDYLGACS